MANQEQLEILKQGVKVWNQWRDENPHTMIDFSGADFTGADLGEVNLNLVNLQYANFLGANLWGANLRQAILCEANLKADLRKTNLDKADLKLADLSGADLRLANLVEAHLIGADLTGAEIDDADLSGADLSGADLRQANLTGAILNRTILRNTNLGKTILVEAKFREADLRKTSFSDANLWRADLWRANLEDANLCDANLNETNLNEANLWGAKLIKADLRDANLRGANLGFTILDRADFSRAKLNEANFREASASSTIFGNTNLSKAIELDQVVHFSPSSLDTHTLQLSKGKIPVKFLRGCGLSDFEIESAKLYNPDLSNQEINDILYKIYDLRARQSIQVSPLFISYCHADAAFVDRLEVCLNEKGIRFWRDIHDAKAGRLETQIEQAIRHNPTVLLVLSKNAIQSDWVQHEVRKAHGLEKELKRDVLCPVALDGSWKSSPWPERVMEQVLEYNILDFSKWEDEKIFDQMFVKLLDGLQLFYKA